MFYKPQNLMKVVKSVFVKIYIFNLFLCELPLIFRVDKKTKNLPRDICKRTLDIEFGLGAVLNNDHTEN